MSVGAIRRAADFDRQPQLEHWPSKMSWVHAMRQFEEVRTRYMREHDSPEERLQSKNPEPFRLP